MIKRNDRLGSKENLKFTIGARNYKTHTAIGERSALDLRAKVVCGAWWCDRLMKKGFFLGSIALFKPILVRSAINCVARHASGAARALRVLRTFVQIQLMCSANGNTLCFGHDSRSIRLTD
jgi:hypothetical protein